MLRSCQAPSQPSKCSPHQQRRHTNQIKGFKLSPPPRRQLHSNSKPFQRRQHIHLTTDNHLSTTLHHKSKRPLSSSSSTTTSNKYEYTTIKHSITDPAVLKEKGSKFLTYAHRVNNDVELKAALDWIKSEHPRATHHCYAFRLGLINDVKFSERANDDGEPSGSAGLPILGQIASSGVTNTLVTVVRYYGGTKLGVSGLIKAYKESAKLVLDQCEIINTELECRLIISFNNYQHQNVLFTMLGKYNAIIDSFDCLEGGGGGDENNVITTQIKMRWKDDIITAASQVDGVTVTVDIDDV